MLLLLLACATAAHSPRRLWCSTDGVFPQGPIDAGSAYIHRQDHVTKHAPFLHVLELERPSPLFPGGRVTFVNSSDSMQLIPVGPTRQVTVETFCAAIRRYPDP